MNENQSPTNVSEGAPAHLPMTALQARQDEAKDSMSDDDYSDLLQMAMATS